MALHGLVLGAVRRRLADGYYRRAPGAAVERDVRLLLVALEELVRLHEACASLEAERQRLLAELGRLRAELGGHAAGAWEALVRERDDALAALASCLTTEGNHGR